MSGGKSLYDSVKRRAEVVKLLEVTWYGMKKFYMKDSNGYILKFGEKSESRPGSGVIFLR